MYNQLAVENYPTFPVGNCSKSSSYVEPRPKPVIRYIEFVWDSVADQQRLQLSGFILINLPHLQRGQGDGVPKACVEQAAACPLLSRTCVCANIFI